VAVLLVTTFLLASIYKQQQKLANAEEDTLDTTLIVSFTAENRTHRAVSQLPGVSLFVP
jgi:hypothetical protein